MAQLVKACPRCGLLMWVKEEAVTYLDENTVRTTCPHCQQAVRLRLVSQGANAAGPKMGH
jgi:RNase P subunit RPR2